MSPKKNNEQKRYRYRRRLGPWYKVGQIFVILGAALIIIAAIIDMIGSAPAPDVWESYTFGWLGVPYLPGIIAIVCAGVILWVILDKRFVYSVHLIVFAIILIVLAIIAGNVGGLICIIGAILIIFEYIARE